MEQPKSSSGHEHPQNAERAMDTDEFKPERYLDPKEWEEYRKLDNNRDRMIYLVTQLYTDEEVMNMLFWS